MTDPSAWLLTVKGAAFDLDRQRHFLEKSIRDAHENGHSLREIAEAAGMSHEKVRGLISRDQASGS